MDGISRRFCKCSITSSFQKGGSPNAHTRNCLFPPGVGNGKSASSSDLKDFQMEVVLKLVKVLVARCSIAVCLDECIRSNVE